MSPLRIDGEALFEALTRTDDRVQVYLDTEEGRLVALTDDEETAPGDEPDPDREAIEADEEERWVEVEPIPGPELGRLRRAFTDGTGGELRRLLDRALEERDGGRRFAAALRATPRDERRWRRFRRERLEQYARAWLEDELGLNDYVLTGFDPE
jgi:hypothetical protein